jgi:ABC-type oligopeptide transport system ATPase subunit
MTVLLRADDLTRAFPVRRGIMDVLTGRPARVVRALAGVTLTVRRGETLAVVGESGCGKSTLARALVRLVALDSGQIDYDGLDVRSLTGAAPLQSPRPDGVSRPVRLTQSAHDR